jgi:DNA polymerase I-like protein with 3'-5' exonuclease and polymerase domains
MSQEEAAPKYEAYWEENWALKEFDEAVAQYWRDHGERYVVLIDGSRVYTRSRHSVTNAVMQGTGAKVMDLSYVFMRKWVKKYQEQGWHIRRVLYYHDELAWECDPEIAQKVGELGCKSIVQAGKYFKMRVPLAAEYKVGNSWAEVH